MADLLREFTDPAVMDIKMGVRYVGGREIVRGEMVRGGKW